MFIGLISLSLVCGRLFGLVAGANAVKTQPQCLDSAAPFASSGKHALCSEYTSLTCCTDAADNLILDRYADIVDELPADDRDTCSPFARDVLCQTCSPYAAILFRRNDNHVNVSLPGLCPNYCRRLYDQCKPLVRLLVAGNDRLVASLDSRDAFCEAVAIDDLCYPDVLTNEEVLTQLNASSDDCVCMQEFASGLQNPLWLRSAEGDSARMFVVEQHGVIHMFYTNGTRRPQPFFNLADSLRASSSSVTNERSFLGLAFHPQFLQNGRFFAYFSVKDDNGHRVRLSEFHVSANDGYDVNNSSEKLILEVEQSFANNNGGEILFGTDGYLYIFLGDGGGKGDPLGNAQNKSVLLGKVLRIDVDSGSPYSIPPDNPFLDDPDARPEIYAYGVRNMWRGDVDEGDPVTGEGRGRIFCRESGEYNYEELNILKKGGNYGWNVKEGFDCLDQHGCGDLENEVRPIYVYNHTDGIAIVGGHMYRGCRNPSMMGHFIFGNLLGDLFNLTDQPPGDQWTAEPLTLCDRAICRAAGLDIFTLRFTLSLGEDSDGEIYVLTTEVPMPNSPYGKVYKLVQPFRRINPDQCQPAPQPDVTTTVDTTKGATDGGEATMSALVMLTICIVSTAALQP